MGKTRDIFKKMILREHFTVKDRNGTDLTEAENIKKRQQEYREELYKKSLNDPDNHNGVIPHLEPDILEGEVKWAIGSITMNKADGGDDIPAELFETLKDDAVKVLHSICQQIWTQQWPQDWKMYVSFQSNPKEGQCQRMFKLLHNCTHFTCQQVNVKIFQARLQQDMNQKISNVQTGFRKGGGIRDQISNICWIIEKQGHFRKISTSASLTMLKPLAIWIITNGKVLKEMVIPDYLTCLLGNSQVKKQHLELHMGQ